MGQGRGCIHASGILALETPWWSLLGQEGCGGSPCRRSCLPLPVPQPAGLSRGRISAVQLSCSHWPLPSWQCRPPSPAVALGKQVVEPGRAQA